MLQIKVSDISSFHKMETRFTQLCNWLIGAWGDLVLCNIVSYKYHGNIMRESNISLTGEAEH